MDSARIRRDGLGLTGVEITEDGLYCDYGSGKKHVPVKKCATCGEDQWDDGDECFDCEERRAEQEYLQYLEDTGHWD